MFSLFPALQQCSNSEICYSELLHREIDGNCTVISILWVSVLFFVFYCSHRSLTKVVVKPEMRKEIEENQKVS